MISDNAAIIGENLNLLYEENTSANERRLAWLRDLAFTLIRDDSFLSDDGRPEKFAALFGYEDRSNAADEESSGILPYFRTASFVDKLTVCKFLAEEFDRRGAKLLDKLLGNTPYPRSPRIAYFKNAYADAAFRVFSEALEAPSVAYASDFNAVCEEVYYERADMCMLPLDSSRDAKLISFYRLIDKYELSPVLSCDVTTPDGSVTTRYALLSKSISLPKKENRSGCFFEFSLVTDDGAALGDVLNAAVECGLTLYKVDSIPLTYSTGKFSSEVILIGGDPKGLDAFVLFLTLAIPEYEPLGIYPHIRQGE